jgi:hypothetical protein
VPNSRRRGISRADQPAPPAGSVYGAMRADPAVTTSPAAPAPRAHLHPFWRYGLALAWAAALVGLLVPENQGYTLGKVPFWWSWVLLVVAAIGVVVALILKDWRWAPLASIGLSLVLVALAIPDLDENAGIAVKQLIIAAGILLVSIGSLSAWSPRSST